MASTSRVDVSFGLHHHDNPATTADLVDSPLSNILIRTPSIRLCKVWPGIMQALSTIPQHSIRKTDNGHQRRPVVSYFLHELLLYTGEVSYVGGRNGILLRKQQHHADLAVTCLCRHGCCAWYPHPLRLRRMTHSSPLS